MLVEVNSSWAVLTKREAVGGVDEKACSCVRGWISKRIIIAVGPLKILITMIEIVTHLTVLAYIKI